MLDPRFSSIPGQLTASLDILGIGVVVPAERLSIESVFEQERAEIEQQLSQLSEGFRKRLLENLGVSEIASFGAESSSTAGLRAATKALSHAGLAANAIAGVFDFTTFAADAPGIWSLAHEVADHVGATRALCLGIHGSGCAGLHAALVAASNLLAVLPEGEAALLVAADRAPVAGRSSLPISIMADAATALVVVRSGVAPRSLARITAVTLQQIGRFSRLLTADGNPPKIRTDATTFERKVLPLHFVMLHRALSRALAQAELQLSDIGGLVYPNTTALDRQGILRGLGLPDGLLIGPGPLKLGHAFANDMLINASVLFDTDGSQNPRRTAWLAAGSGFSWGAAIVEFRS